MDKKFDRQAFNVKFDELVLSLHDAEKITKPALATLSRMVLEQIHFDGDIQPVNRLLNVLTPMNRKVAVLFFQAFTGFLYTEKTQSFGKKDKNLYAQKFAAYEKETEEESFNIWTWAEREIVIDSKPFDVSKITSTVASLLKKADKNNISKLDFIKAIMDGGVSTDELIGALQALDIVDVKDNSANDEQKEQAA